MAATRPVPVTTFKALFHSIAETLQRPSPATAGPWEPRLNALGQHVGRCMLAQWEPTGKNVDAKRMLTTDEAINFVATEMFIMWFGAKPDTHFRGADDDLNHYINADVPFITQRTTHGHYGAFVAGMIKGVLDACGFLCEVTAYYSEETGVKTQYMISWAPSVIQRERTQAERKRKPAQ
jgi:hypothetical protein